MVENNNSYKTVAELADARHLGTLVNRPLKAYHGRELIRLADFGAHDELTAKKVLDSALAEAVRLELELSKTDDTALATWARMLTDHRKDIRSIIQWKDILGLQIRPFLSSLSSPRQKPYLDAMTRAVQAMTEVLESRESARSGRIKEALSRYCPSLTSTPSLSGKTIRILSSFPGIDCVLVGMRKPEYVRDALSAGAPLSTEEAFESLNAISELIENEQLGAQS